MGLIFEWGLLDLAFVLGLLSFLGAQWVLRRYKHFEHRGFPFLEPKFLLGSNFELFMRKKTFNESMRDMYRRLAPHDIGGYFQVVTPMLMVRSPALLESVLVKDFSYFHDHGFAFDPELDPLEAHLFNQSGARWRALRNKLSPIFTTGKLRSMAPQMTQVSDRLVALIQSNGPEEIDVRNIVSRFAIDVIGKLRQNAFPFKIIRKQNNGSCAFGLDAGALQDPGCKFKQMADTIFRPRSKVDSVKPLVRVFLPSLARFLGIRAVPPDVVQFFTQVTEQAFEHRIKTGIKRNDFVDLLLELKIKGDVVCEDAEPGSTPQQRRLVFTDELLTAQSFIFLAAGWETISTAMTLTLYFIARDPDVQREARRSTKKAKAAYGEIGFEAVRSMDYLDYCLSETMRLYPPAASLFRVCTRDYRLSDGRLIEKGARLVVPVSGIQRDSQYWGPEAELYRPGRFRPEALKYQSVYTKKDDEDGLYHREDPEEEEHSQGEEDDHQEGVRKMTYLPFGAGPRICIGQRFALLEAKMAIAKILDTFELSLGPSTQEPPRLDPKSFLSEMLGGTWIKFDKIKQTTLPK